MLALVSCWIIAKMATETAIEMHDRATAMRRRGSMPALGSDDGARFFLLFNIAMKNASMKVLAKRTVAMYSVTGNHVLGLGVGRATATVRYNAIACIESGRGGSNSFTSSSSFVKYKALLFWRKSNRARKIKKATTCENISFPMML
mgnify:CR=1 FL=1